VLLAAGELELRGLGLRQIADLFLMFPSLRNLFVEGAPAIEATDIILGAPDAIGTIIALAAGQPEAAEKIVDIGAGLAPDEILECLEVIYDLTFPRGIAPFLQKAIGLLAPPVPANGAAGPSGRAPDTSTPQEPKSSLPPDMLAAK
jgi:hypothetical protein